MAGWDVSLCAGRCLGLTEVDDRWRIWEERLQLRTATACSRDREAPSLVADPRRIRLHRVGCRFPLHQEALPL